MRQQIPSSSGTLQTDRTYTDQKQDGTGLHYYNARYYDSALGTFLSPDTLVPDAGRVVDYNRFLYVRGNPLKYNDPSGHYSNEEIMQHYGCEDWACVEAFFQDDGAYAGMWGWLYILQMAQDGDRLTASYGWTGVRLIYKSTTPGFGLQLSSPFIQRMGVLLAATPSIRDREMRFLQQLAQNTSSD